MFVEKFEQMISQRLADEALSSSKVAAPNRTPIEHLDHFHDNSSNVGFAAGIPIDTIDPSSAGVRQIPPTKGKRKTVFIWSCSHFNTTTNQPLQFTAEYSKWI
ncbi:hypothetical protein LTS17_010074 [Exophiala oligosperma]